MCAWFWDAARDAFCVNQAPRIPLHHRGRYLCLYQEKTNNCATGFMGWSQQQPQLGPRKTDSKTSEESTLCVPIREKIVFQESSCDRFGPLSVRTQGFTEKACSCSVRQVWGVTPCCQDQPCVVEILRSDIALKRELEVWGREGQASAVVNS